MATEQRGGPEPDAERRRERIVAHPSYRPADRDPDLLELDELRPVRLVLEYLKPELALRDLGVQATIVVFGSTRIREPGLAREGVERARAALLARPGDRELERRLRVAEQILARSPAYEVARELGRIVGRFGKGPPDGRLAIMTGGGPGLMEAANRGADETGARSAGLNIALPREQSPNPYIAPELCFRFRYFAMRKMHFMLRARAFVAFPGGFGTFDELFETLCLIQTGKREPLPVVLVGEEFWRRAFDAGFLAAEGMIDPGDLELFRYAESAEEIWRAICGWYEERGLSVLP